MPSLRTALFMRLVKLLPGLLLVLGALMAHAGQAPGAKSPMLPKQFGGWQMSGMPRLSTDPAVPDPINPALLKEYGFTDFESAAYLRDDGRKLAIKAARFTDATGAYAAFTYYRMRPMITEEIGDQGASLNERVLFRRGNILVDAVFAKLSAMSAAELRELASDLPLPPGNAGNAPDLPGYLPRQSLIANSIKYALGPVALDKLNAPLPASLVDFNAGAEVVMGNYNSSGGEATLAVISYPTPQIAAEQLRRMDAAHAAFYDRRSGPIVAVVSGPISQSEAKSLLASVNYDADVTWNENTHFTKRDNLANLLVNIIILCGIILGFALVSGLAFGGLRVLALRVFPVRWFGRADEVEFIALHLSQTDTEAADSKVSRSIKVG
jgi:hypothetical protein